MNGRKTEWMDGKRMNEWMNEKGVNEWMDGNLN